MYADIKVFYKHVHSLTLSSWTQFFKCLWPVTFYDLFSGYSHAYCAVFFLIFMSIVFGSSFKEFNKFILIGCELSLWLWGVRNTFFPLLCLWDFRFDFGSELHISQKKSEEDEGNKTVELLGIWPIRTR